MDPDAEDFVIVNHEDAISEQHPATSSLGEISRFIDGISSELWPINKKMHDSPELAWKEKIAHATLTAYLHSKPEWKVTPSAYNLETAWIAEYDSGKEGPVISFNVEMDALPGIGHACGHNLIAMASLSAALATASIIKEHGLAGKVVAFGTPAEEGGGGKIALLEAGAYRDHHVDLNLISHPGIVPNAALVRTTANESFRVEYFGREAHAALKPWDGINALDALITAYNALSVLRQQTMPGDIVQGFISHGGVAPNIIHAYAAGEFVARAETQARLRELRKKVDACFEAGATAAGARLKVTPLHRYADHVPNRVLGASYTRHFNALSPEDTEEIPLDQDVDERRGATKASTDQGDISYAMPSLSAGFYIVPGPEGRGPHNPEFAAAAGTRAAFGRCLRVGKALAATAVDVLTTEGMLDEVKAKWREDMKKHGARDENIWRFE